MDWVLRREIEPVIGQYRYSNTAESRISARESGAAAALLERLGQRAELRRARLEELRLNDVDQPNRPVDECTA